MSKHYVLVIPVKARFARLIDEKTRLITVACDEIDAPFINRACNSHDALVEKLRANHRAVDWLMSRLIELNPEFMPSKSPIWPDVKGTADLLSQMEQP